MQRMKLYLSSYRLGNEPAALRTLVGGGVRAAIVLNACDAFEYPRFIWSREYADISGLGFDAVELDLREYFGDPTGLSEAICGIDLLWVVGGNTFVLARAMSAAGFVDVVTQPLQAGTLTYAGYSAGAGVTTPGWEVIELMDDPNALPIGYPSIDRPPTLAWVPWRIVPHWRSDHPESALADQAVEALLTAELPFRTLRDGHAIVVDGGDEHIVGTG
ncbi:MAG: serine peptidase [Ilumatobacteraceae bacterium]|nr:serine peptidase [Ilumatobacteraceae bacterium]